MEIITTAAISLIATIIIESGVLLLLKEQRRQVYIAEVIINILTNIPLNVWAIVGYRIFIEIIIAEIIIMIVESLWYYMFVKRVRTATIYGVLCNTISFLTGILITLIIELAYSTFASYS